MSADMDMSTTPRVLICQYIGWGRSNFNLLAAQRLGGPVLEEEAGHP